MRLFDKFSRKTKRLEKKSKRRMMLLSTLCPIGGAVVCAAIIIPIVLMQCSKGETARNIVINGSQSLYGDYGTDGSQQYEAKYDTGKILNDGTWDIIDPISGLKATGLVIDSTGKVSWTATATSGSFIITCAKDGFNIGKLSVNFKSHSVTSFLVTTDDITYTIDTSGDFMTSRTEGGTFDFTKVGGGPEQVDRNKIRLIELNDLPSISTVPDNYGKNLCANMTNLVIADINLPTIINYTGHDFCYNMFYNCTSIISLPYSFNLPSSITTVGTRFCFCMFFNCTSLISLPANFNLPQLLTTIPMNNSATAFCYGMFYNCTRLQSLPSGFNLPQGIQNAGTMFCIAMFRNCSSLSSLPMGFNIPSSIVTARENFCESMFRECKQLTSTGATSPQDDIIIPNINPVPSGFCENMFTSSDILGHDSPDANEHIPVKRNA